MKYLLIFFMINALTLVGCGKQDQPGRVSGLESGVKTDEQERGGGNFTVPVFWEKVLTEIKPELESLKDEQILTKIQVQKLLGLMDKDSVEIRLSEIKLTIKEDDDEVPVDAINYPALRLIELDKTSWEYTVKQGHDVNYLILHEFLGLANIDDTNYKISSKILPPKRLNISFDSNQISCEVAGKFLFKTIDNDWLIRDMPESDTVVTVLSKSESKDNVAIKTARVEMPVITDTEAQPDSKYSIVADIQLADTYKNHGWGDASNELFDNPAKLYITWRLLETQADGKVISLAIAQNSTSQTNEDRDFATLSENIPVSSFVEKLSQNGYTLRLASYKGEMTDMFHSYNIAGFLKHTAEVQGLKGEEANSFIVNTVLKGFPKAMPFRVWVGCKLLAPGSTDPRLY